MIADILRLLLPSCSAIFQGVIVNVAGTTEGLGKLRRLLVSGKESVLEGLPYYHEGILHYTGSYCEDC
jgi:hypothetical protein